MKVLVTGGGGFVGFKVVEMLRKRGDDVRVIARGEHPRVVGAGAELVRGDLADKEVAPAGVDGVDAVVHVAAKAGVWGDPADYERSNVTATQNVIDACVAAGVDRLVMTSSPSVTFHGGDTLNGDESLPYASKHLYHYGRTKAESERRVLKANATPHKKGPGVLLTCALRPHLVYGPGDPHILPRLVSRAKAGRLAWIGSGKNVVDVTYVDNAAHAHLLALDALGADKAKPAGKAYFISQGTPVSPPAWVNRILKDIGLAEVTRKVPYPVAYALGGVLEGAWSLFGLKGEPMMTRFMAAELATSHTYDLTAARRDLGYEPIVDDDEAHERAVAWLRSELTAGRL